MFNFRDLEFKREYELCNLIPKYDDCYDEEGNEIRTNFHGDLVNFVGEEVQLDGYFSVEKLKILVNIMENIK